MPIPQITTLVTLAAEATITVNYATASAEVITVPAGTARYTGGEADEDEGWSEYIKERFNNLPSAYGWSWTNQAGTPYGRTSFSIGPINDQITSFTFSSLALANILGYDSTTPTVTVTGSGIARTSTIAAPHTRQGLWTAHATVAQPTDDLEYRRNHTTLTTAPPAFGDKTTDIYYSDREGVLRIFGLYAASCLEHYREQSDWVAKVGTAADPDDPNLDFESLAYAWLRVSEQKARLSPDRTVPGVYDTIQTNAASLANLVQSGTLRRISINPLLFSMELPIRKA